MTEPKVITEADAQKLANWTGCIVTQDRRGFVLLWKQTSKPRPHIGMWALGANCKMMLPISIDSTRPLTEQIWRPEV